MRQSEKVLPNQVIMFGVLSRAAGNREVFELMCARPKRRARASASGTSAPHLVIYQHNSIMTALVKIA